VQNFLTYRIAATLQLVSFFIIALLAFEPSKYEPEGLTGEERWPDYFFIPVILLMLITLLNDGTMITIGYDRVTAPTRPAKVCLPSRSVIQSGLALSSAAIGWDARRSVELSSQQQELRLSILSVHSAQLLILACCVVEPCTAP
jgi:H+-transporting ATPase